MNLTQSAAARQNKEQYIISGPCEDIKQDEIEEAQPTWIKTNGTSVRSSSKPKGGRTLNRATSASVRQAI
jgi:hypothetical protein